MIKYTEEEIRSFMYPIVLYNRESDGTIHIRLTLNSKMLFVRGDIVMGILRNGNFGDFIFNSFQKDLYQTDVSVYYRILSILHKVPFDMLPIFINTYPEIAPWRLKIGR